MNLELFTVLYKENGSIGIEFNEELLQVATEEELISEMSTGIEMIVPIVAKLMKFLKTKI